MKKFLMAMVLAVLTTSSVYAIKDNQDLNGPKSAESVKNQQAPPPANAEPVSDVLASRAAQTSPTLAGQSLACEVFQAGNWMASMTYPGINLDRTGKIPLSLPVTEYNFNCDKIDAEQHIRVFRATDLGEDRLFVRYADGRRDFSEFVFGGDGLDENMAYYPSIPIEDLVKEKVFIMTTSDISGHWGPDIDVVCVLGANDHDQYGADLSWAVQNLKSHPLNRSNDATASYQARVKQCENK